MKPSASGVQKVISQSREKSMDRQITLKVPEEMFWDLRRLSEKKGIPTGKVIRRAVDDYIRKSRLKGIL